MHISFQKPKQKLIGPSDAIQIHRNIRAFNPWPVAFIQLDEQNNLRVWNSELS